MGRVATLVARVGARRHGRIVVAGAVIAAAACTATGRSSVRMEVPAGAAPGRTEATSTAGPAPAAAGEPGRHAPDPAGLDADRRAVLATHRAFWDALIPPGEAVMRPRWDDVAKVAAPSVVDMYRDSFRRDTEREGGLALRIDLAFTISAVEVDGDRAFLAGCVRQTGSVERIADGVVVGADDAHLAYAGALTRDGGRGWRFDNVEVGEPCPG